MRKASCLALLLLGMGFPAQSQETQQLKQIEEQLLEGEAKKQELTQRAKELSENDELLRSLLIEAVREVQDNGLKLVEMDRKLSEIEAAVKNKESALREKNKDLALSIRSLLRLAAAPDIAMLFQPQRQDNIAESSKLLASASASLNKGAAKLKKEISEIAALKEDAKAARLAIWEEKAILAQNQQKLSALLEQNKLARLSNREEEAKIDQRMKELADQAQNLKELIEGSRGALGYFLPKPPSIRSLTSSGQGYVWPVKGEIVANFGESSSYFGEAGGMVVSTGLGAEIIAPFDGKVAFSGPFRSFGHVLIIEHLGGYHTILAGLDRIDAVTGQWLLAGEPIGAMSKKKTGSDTPKLYIELRQDDHIIDPAKWLYLN